nr:hypothetical protein Iba_chr01aCG2370 [Ipomoea batatas]
MIWVDTAHPTEVIRLDLATPTVDYRHSPAMDADDTPLISGMDALGIPAVSSLELAMDVTFESPKTWTPTVDAYFCQRLASVSLPWVWALSSTWITRLLVASTYGIVP